MKPAPLSARTLKSLGILAPALAMLSGCQALDKSIGINKDDKFNVRESAPAVQPRLGDVPKPLTAQEQGLTLREQGLREQALQAFEKAIAENPLAVTSYVNAGDIYFEKGDVATSGPTTRTG